MAAQYEDEGAGPVLLLLHGWKDTRRTFDALALMLSADFRVIRLDLPGFGGSESPRMAWTLDDYVRFVNDFTAKVGVTPRAVIGHSFGGRIAIKGVSEGVLKPEKIVLIDSAGIARRRTLRNAAFALLAKIGKAMTLVPPFSFWRDALRRVLYERLGSDYFAAGSLRETFLNTIREDLSDAAERITTPTLLIWGSADRATPLADGERLSRLIRGSTLKVIPGAGHFVHREEPAQVAALIRNFL